MANNHLQPNTSTEVQYPLCPSLSPVTTFWTAAVLLYVAFTVYTILHSINTAVGWRDVAIKKEEVALKKNAAVQEAAHIQTCLNFQRQAAQLQSSTDDKLRGLSNDLDKLRGLDHKFEKQARELEAILREAKLREEERHRDRSDRSDLESRLRQAESQLAVKNEEVAELKRRFDRKFD
ncbi:hypothetical protein F4819DRAFT_483724 [Hypoxylon fuscum]|nr:hypothetical protein F4819DRAFT_483724 [Hypoxylon fuscum]